MPLSRHSSVILLGFIALAAAIVAGQPKSPSQGERGEEKKKTGEAKSALISDEPQPLSWVNGPLGPIWGFAGGSPDEPDSSWKVVRRYGLGAPNNSRLPTIEEQLRGQSERGVYKWPTRGLDEYSIRFLIATVPDPTDSGFGYLFDQVVEAVQRALEVDNYVLDRGWLPWTRSVRGGATGGSDVRLHERHPGVILFRAPPNRLLVLCLVGETPTAGIQKTAFFNSLVVIRNCPPKLQAEGCRVRVVGPYFSGSWVSLRDALRRARATLPAQQIAKEWAAVLEAVKGVVIGGEWARLFGSIPVDQPIKVVCGSANAFNPATFKQGWTINLPLCPSEPEFETTVLPDYVIREWVYRYLDNPSNPSSGTQPDSVVILQEANTGFGQLFLYNLKHPPRHSAAYPTDTTKRPNETASSKAKQVFVVPFPLHISQLRASYTKDQVAKLESLGLPRSRTNLPFPQDQENSGGREPGVLEAQAPLMTAAMNDLIISNITSTLAEKRAKYVGLVATDVRDIIFLANLVRTRSPDVQLFTTGSELLFAHPDYNFALRGMIVGSVYPLHPLTQRWSNPCSNTFGGSVFPIDLRYHALFATDPFQGYYNATRVQLTDHGKAPAKMIDYGWRDSKRGREATMPPICISVVGQNGQMIPVYHVCPTDFATEITEYPLYKRPIGPLQQTRNVKDHDADPGDTNANVGATEFPNMWFLLFVVIVLITWRCLTLARDYTADTPAFGLVCFAFIALYWLIARLCSVPIRRGPVDSWLSTEIVASGSIMVIAFTVIVIFVAMYASASWRSLSRSGLVSFRFYFTDTLIVGLVLWISFDSFVSGRQNPPIIWAIMIVIAGAIMTAFIRYNATERALWRRVVVGWCALLSVGLGSALIQRSLVPLTLQEITDFERFVHLTNGVTPLLPAFLLLAALAAGGMFLIRASYLRGRFSVDCPFPKGGQAAFEYLNEFHQNVQDDLTAWGVMKNHPWWFICGLVLLLLCAFKIAYEAVPPLDGLLFGLVTFAGFLVCTGLLVFTVLQFCLVWKDLRKILHKIAQLPMIDALDRLPEKVVSTFGHYLRSIRPRRSHLPISVQQFRFVLQKLEPFRKDLWDRAGLATPYAGLGGMSLRAAAQELNEGFPPGKWDSLPAQFEKDCLAKNAGNPSEDDIRPRAHEKWEAANRPAGDDLRFWYAAEQELRAKARVLMRNGWSALLNRLFARESPQPEDCETTARDLSTVTQGCLSVLRWFWPAHSLEEAFGRPVSAKKPAKPGRTFLSLPEGDAIREWALVAEDFVAIELIRYLNQFVVQLRNKLWSVMVASVIMLLAASTYPFVPQSLLLLFLTGLSGAAAITMLAFFYQVNKDEVVSRLTRTTPNRFTPDVSFVTAIATYVLPIVGALVIQFPFFASGIRSLFDPLFHVIR
jgi:hypothetical protein